MRCHSEEKSPNTPWGSGALAKAQGATRQGSRPTRRNFEGVRSELGECETKHQACRQVGYQRTWGRHIGCQGRNLGKQSVRQGLDETAAGQAGANMSLRLTGGSKGPITEAGRKTIGIAPCAYRHPHPHTKTTMMPDKPLLRTSGHDGGCSKMRDVCHNLAEEGEVAPTCSHRRSRNPLNGSLQNAQGQSKRSARKTQAATCRATMLAALKVRRQIAHGRNAALHNAGILNTLRQQRHHGQ